MRPMSIKKINQRGFTLVEVAVVAPVMILIALAIVAILIALVSGTVGPNARSILIQQGQKAFDSMESDVNNSSGLLSTLTVPANFTDNAASDYSSPPSGTTVLRIQTYDQIQNPNDSSGTKVIPAFKDTSPCSNTTVLDSNNIVPIVVVYFVKNNTLYRRTLTDTTTPATCGTKLAKSTGCGSCTSEDIALIRADSITKFEVTYYDSVTLDSNPSSIASASSKSAKITIASSLEAGGDTIKYTANLRVARLNKPDF